MESVFGTDFFQDPRLLSPEEVAAALDKQRHILAWVAALDEAALAMAYSEGVSIPRYKAVLSGGRRYVSDPEAVITALEGAGYTFEEVGKRSARGIGELEKLLGREKFDKLIGSYIGKTEGKPSMVPESDNRPAVNPTAEAKKEFQ